MVPESPLRWDPSEKALMIGWPVSWPVPAWLCILAVILTGAIIVRDEISCLRDRHGACVSLLRPVQPLINPLIYFHPLLFSEAKDCGGWRGAGFVLAGTLWLWVSSSPCRAIKSFLWLRYSTAQNIAHHLRIHCLWMRLSDWNLSLNFPTF